jgi:hypothetical protein
VRYLVPVFFAVATLFPTERVPGQTCLGTASFAAGLVRAGATLSTTDGAKSYGGHVAVGAPTGPFANFGVARSDFDDIDAKATSFSIGVGYAIEVTPAGHVQFCPQITHVRQSGPDFDTGFGTVKTSLRASVIGASLGGSLRVTPRLDFVPFAAAAYVATRGTLETEQESEQSDTEDSGQMQLGAGFVLDRRLTLQPAVLIPLGSDGSNPIFMLMLAWNFGPARK